MSNRAEGQPPNAQLDFSKPFSDAEKYVKRATRWCYSIFFFTVLIFSGASTFLYFLGDSINPWVKTGLSASLSLLLGTLIREFSLSLKRSREVENLILVLGLCVATYGNNAELPQIIMQELIESLSSRNQPSRPWLKKITPGAKAKHSSESSQSRATG
jgi:hypothetical protein